MAKVTKKKPAQQAPSSKKIEFKPEGRRLEEVKDKEVPVPRLYEYYKQTIIPNLMKKFNYRSPMQVPRLEKIVLNMGIGGATQDQRLLLNALNELEIIAGQRPVISKAKKSISNFKLRSGVPIGCFVTLRRARMYEFLDRFINIAAPRIRDFRGFSDKSFDGHGNYSVGIREQIIFPEIDVDKVTRISGLDITFVIRSKSDEESYALLNEFGFPFQRKD
ncbi:MAG: 50S ribosomal protein L5 [Ignavibacteria bacterium]|nr:50S ribosomal protein L5 [Ignavibacteria bacterium]